MSEKETSDEIPAWALGSLVAAAIAIPTVASGFIATHILSRRERNRYIVDVGCDSDDKVFEDIIDNDVDSFLSDETIYEITIGSPEVSDIENATPDDFISQGLL